jgi:hypothetical protein
MAKTYFIVVAMLVLLVGCAKPEPRQVVNFDREIDFSRLQTWTWADDRPVISDVLIGDEPIDRFIRKAVTQELNDKGLRLVVDHPDFQIMYFTHVRDDVATQQGVYGENYGWRWVKDLVHGWSREADRTGTLELRILDGSGQKELWKGEISAPVKDASEARVKIPEAVKRLLDGFPPGG